MTEIKPIVWINAFPGTGKLTVAKELVTLFAADDDVDSPVKLIDNHSLIDPVEAKFSRQHPDYQAERRRKRQAVFDEFVLDLSMLGRTIIFTDFQSDLEPGPTTAREYEEAARQSRRPLVPVYLLCDDDENVRWMVHKDRVASGTTKLTDVELLRSMRSRVGLFRFDSVDGQTLDVSRLSPTQAAREIKAHLEDAAVAGSGSGSASTRASGEPGVSLKSGV